MPYVPTVELRHTTVMTSQNWEQDEPDLKPRCPMSEDMVVESDNWCVCDSLRQLQKVFQKIFLLIHYILKLKKKQMGHLFLTKSLVSCATLLCQLNNVVVRLVTWGLCTEAKLHRHA